MAVSAYFWLMELHVWSRLLRLPGGWFGRTGVIFLSGVRGPSQYGGSGGAGVVGGSEGGDAEERTKDNGWTDGGNAGGDAEERTKAYRWTDGGNEGGNSGVGSVVNGDVGGGKQTKLWLGQWVRKDGFALSRYEPTLFTVALLLHLLPVLCTAGWYTFDGPAHLYNAQVIGELILGSGNAFLESWYFFRWPPAPNLLYYIITVPLTRMVSPEWVDKIWACLHILIFGMGFRYFMRQVAGGNWTSGLGRVAAWSSWIGLYGIYHRHFFLGQYNFAVSMGLLWWTLGCAWRLFASGSQPGVLTGSNITSGQSGQAGQSGQSRQSGQAGQAGQSGQSGDPCDGQRVFNGSEPEAFTGSSDTAGRPGPTQEFLRFWPVFRLGCLLTLLGTSHLVGFAAAGLCLLILLLWRYGHTFRRLILHGLCLLLISLPALVINLSFLWRSEGTGITRHIGGPELLGQWIRLEALTSFNPPVEWRSMAGLFLLGALTLPMALWAAFRNGRMGTGGKKPIMNLNPGFYLLICSFTLIVLYFLLPDESRNSGYLSSRLALTGQLLWLAGGGLFLGVLPRGARRVVVGLLLLLLPLRVAYYLRIEQTLGRNLAEFREVARHIPPGSVVHQVNFSSNWMHEHLSMSVSGKEVVHLKNYEAYLDYFPLGWKTDALQPWLGQAKYWNQWSPCPDSLALQRLSSPPLPDFLIVWWGETDMTNSPTGENGCRKVLSYWLNRHYRLVNTSTNSHVQLMKRDLKAIP